MRLKRYKEKMFLILSRSSLEQKQNANEILHTGTCENKVLYCAISDTYFNVILEHDVFKLCNKFIVSAIKYTALF